MACIAEEPCIVEDDDDGKLNTKIRRSTVGSTHFSDSPVTEEFGAEGVSVRTDIMPTENLRGREETAAGAPLDETRIDPGRRTGTGMSWCHDVRSQYSIVTPSVYTTRCCIRVHYVGSYIIQYRRRRQ